MSKRTGTRQRPLTIRGFPELTKPTSNTDMPLPVARNGARNRLYPARKPEHFTTLLIDNVAPAHAPDLTAGARRRLAPTLNTRRRLFSRPVSLSPMRASHTGPEAGSVP